MSRKPPSGHMVYWRFKSNQPSAYRFGYVTHKSNNLILMGRWNGDTMGGSVVDADEIEWKDYGL